MWRSVRRAAPHELVPLRAQRVVLGCARPLALQCHAVEHLLETGGSLRGILRLHRGLGLRDARAQYLGAARAVQLLALVGYLFVHPARPLEVAGLLDLRRRHDQVLQPVGLVVAEGQPSRELGVALTGDAGELVRRAEFLFGGSQHLGVRAQRGSRVTGLLLPVAHVAQHAERRLCAALPLGPDVHLLIAPGGLLAAPGPAVPVGQLVAGQFGVRVTRPLA